MAKIEELLKGKDDLINYTEILTKNPWLSKKNQKCILSPDSDGLLCGLFMSYYLDWKIIGFYDGKVCLLKNGESAYAEDTCFLDIEIYREGVKSMGHHMLCLYNNAKPDGWDNKFKQCVQPNLLRNYDRNSFRLKYPLATIHLLIGLLEKVVRVNVEESAIFPLLFTDGTFNVMFSYPENVMNWWKYLRVADNSRLLNSVFLGENYTVFRLMKEMYVFFRERDKISVATERGDRLKISNKNGSPHNVEQMTSGLYKINDDAKSRCFSFLKLLELHTRWTLNEDKWTFENMNLMQFTKGDFKGRNWTITKANWKNLLELNPLSWAMTSSDNVEFTQECPDTLI